MIKKGLKKGYGKSKELIRKKELWLLFSVLLLALFVLINIKNFSFSYS